MINQRILALACLTVIIVGGWRIWKEWPPRPAPPWTPTYSTAYFETKPGDLLVIFSKTGDVTYLEGQCPIRIDLQTGAITWAKCHD